MMTKRRLDEIVWPVVRHVVLIVGAVVMITPFVWMVSVSLKPAQEVYQPKFTIFPGVSPAGEVDIVLESTGRGGDKLKVVNAILVNLGLASEIDFVDGMSLQKGVTREEGENFKRIVEEAGGKVRLTQNCHATTGDFLRPVLCRNWSLIDNYEIALNPRRGNLMRYMFNGVIVTLVIFFAQVLIAIPCAYALAKLRFRGRQFIFFMVIFCLLIPPQVPAIPLYYGFWKIGIIDTYAGLCMPFIISVFGIFLFRQFFMSVPDDLIDAARLDGFGEYSLVWRVMVPTAIPAITAFGIFSISIHWNDFFWPLIIVNSDALYTPPIGIMKFRNAEAGNNFGAIMAASTIIIAPLVLMFLFAQKRFIEGITFSAVKG